MRIGIGLGFFCAALGVLPGAVCAEDLGFLRKPDPTPEQKKEMEKREREKEQERRNQEREQRRLDQERARREREEQKQREIAEKWAGARGERSARVAVVQHLAEKLRAGKGCYEAVDPATLAPLLLYLDGLQREVAQGENADTWSVRVHFSSERPEDRYDVDFFVSREGDKFKVLGHQIQPAPAKESAGK